MPGPYLPLDPWSNDEQKPEQPTDLAAIVQARRMSGEAPLAQTPEELQELMRQLGQRPSNQLAPGEHVTSPSNQMAPGEHVVERRTVIMPREDLNKLLSPTDDEVAQALAEHENSPFAQLKKLIGG